MHESIKYNDMDLELRKAVLADMRDIITAQRDQRATSGLYWQINRLKSKGAHGQLPVLFSVPDDIVFVYDGFQYRCDKSLYPIFIAAMSKCDAGTEEDFYYLSQEQRKKIFDIVRSMSGMMTSVEKRCITSLIK
jgi:hypothetical protein